MSELFIELYSEEIPSTLQKDARERIKRSFEEILLKKEIKFTLSKSYSTPKRLVFLITGIPDKIKYQKKLLKGPKAEAPQVALDGFIKSNELVKSDIFKKKTGKGEFYFANIESKEINVLEELKLIIPNVLQNYTWKKSMKWSDYDLSWGRPLRSIITLFNNKLIEFNFFHLKSGNFTFIDTAKGEKIKKISNFSSYSATLKSENIILDHEERKKIINKKFNSICTSRNLNNNFNEKLIEEVVNLVEKPNIIICKFNEIYLKIPREILIITMQQHQKYFPLFDNNNKLINSFLIVANLPDIEGYIKTGNQRVIEARLSDAKFFWEKNKNQNLVKQVSKLKNLVYFKKLGTFYDRTQRLRKLASPISDNLNISKEKVEIASSISKADLVSDLVGEFPELQGVMGKYLAREQGFEEDVCIAISEHYLPVGLNSNVPKKLVSSAVAIIDKIDALIGFFGIDEKPTSSKDPFALRRTAIGLLRIIIENKLNIKIKDLLNYSITTYKDQNIKLTNDLVVKDILFFLRERFKNLLKEKKIRNDIIEAVDSSHSSNNFLDFYMKCNILNKNLSNDIFKNVIRTYKRVSSIIDRESKDKKDYLDGLPESFLFKKVEEKNLFEKINEIRKYFSNTKKSESYDETLRILHEAKPVADNFFDNVIVNDENSDIKKNRLELLRMFCKTYNSFVDFSKVEGI